MCLQGLPGTSLRNFSVGAQGEQFLDIRTSAQCTVRSAHQSFLISLGMFQISFQKPQGKSLQGKHVFVRLELSRLTIDINSTQFLFFLFISLKDLSVQENTQ